MESKQFEVLLRAPQFSLEEGDEGLLVGEGATLTVFVSNQGESVRFGKLSALDVHEDLKKVGLVGLVREGAYTVVSIKDIVAVEREESDPSKEKRRTGFV